MAAKERALDIFQLLGDIDKKNYGLWDKLTDEQKKEALSKIEDAFLEKE